MFVVVWSFRIHEDSREQFERAYGPNGTWVDLFRSGKGYIQTELLRDVKENNRYLTIDRWSSEADYDLFRERRRAEYENLDRMLGALNLKEEHVGSFTLDE